MTDLVEAALLAVEAIRSRKARAMLATVGVMIGVASVIALVAVGQVAHKDVAGEFGGLGPDVLWVLPGKAKDGEIYPLQEGRLTLTVEDASAVAREATAVGTVAPVLRSSIPVSSQEQKTTTTVFGTTPDFFAMNQFTVGAGRLLQEADLARGKRVAVLGASLAQRLFVHPVGGIGLRVGINGRAFEVVGVLNSKGQLLGTDLDDRVFIPLPAAQRLFRVSHVTFLYVRVHQTVFVPLARQEIERVLYRRHGQEDITVVTQSQLLRALDGIFRVFTVTVSSIAGISLVVSGIGIMNIMLVAVTERTREIGIRRAVGARQGHIFRQFLIEAIATGLVGGILGVALGAAISWGVSSQFFRSLPSLGDLVSITVLAFGLSIVVGVVFGVYPAWRAARLSPVDALRYE